MAPDTGQWGSSAVLTALQELIDASIEVPHAVARRGELTASELHALRQLATGAIGPADLARRLGLTTAAASAVIARLEQHGLVTRRAHATDGRRTIVELSPAGRDYSYAHLSSMFRQLAALDSSLDDDARAIVVDFLQRATAAVRSVG